MAYKNRTAKRTLMMISPEDLERVTLQNVGPVRAGKVLGRYSSPLFRLKSWKKLSIRMGNINRTAYLLNVEASRANNGARAMGRG